MLRRLGLHFARGSDIGDEGHVDRDGVLVSHLETKLANRFEEGQRLDITDGAADLDDEDVHIGSALENA